MEQLWVVLVPFQKQLCWLTVLVNDGERTRGSVHIHVQQSLQQKTGLSAYIAAMLVARNSWVTQQPTSL